MVPVDPVVICITFVFTFHMCCNSSVRSSYFLILLASFLIKFLSPEIATFINVCSIFIIKDYDVWFMLRYVSVSLHLLISLYGYLSFMICFYQFWQMLIWESYVYWTVHHLDSWIKRDQLDITCFIISLFNAQHVSDVNTCFSLHTDTTPHQPNHNITPTHIEPEQYNPWNNLTNKSQAPEDGCINIRNMLSIK